MSLFLCRMSSALNYSCGNINISEILYSLTQVVKKWWLLCTVKQAEIVTKLRKTMGLNYTIDCRHCGSHTEYHASTNRRTLRVDTAHLSDNVDTECAIRCPVCRSRLNTTRHDFLTQVKISIDA